MSLKEYQLQEEERQKAALQSRQHYEKLNLPGVRKMTDSAEAVRKRIEEMKKVRQLPNHD